MSGLHRFSRWLGVIAAWLLCGATAAWSAKADRWLRLSTPEFTIFTTLGESDASAWAGEFSQFVAALRGYFAVGDRAFPPLTMVLFARDRDFEKYRPLDAKGKPEPVAGFFGRHETWSVAGMGGGSMSEELRHTIFHEGVHWFLSTSETPSPVWLEEGLAEVFATFEISKGQAEWGKAIPSHVQLLRREGLLNLEKLLYTGREGLFGRDEVRTSLVYAQSWALTHYLVFGQHNFPRGAIADYGRLTQEGVTPDEAFRRAFGTGYNEVEKALKTYVSGGSYYVRRRPLAAFAPPQIGPAAQVDVENALGRLAWAGRRWELAATHARAGMALAFDDPRGHELLGHALQQSGDTSGAVAAFTLAAERKSQDALTYFELALAEQNSAASPGGSISAMGGDDARRIANRYERAINLYPRLKLAYENLAGVLGIAEPVSAEDRRFLELGQKLWPGDPMIKVGLGILTYRTGDQPAAKALLTQVLSAGGGEAAAARDYARRTLGNWEQQEIITTINRLVEEQKFAEGVAFIDERLAGGVVPAIRAQLEAMRGPLVLNVAWKELDGALKDGRWAEARARLATVIEADTTPAGMRTQARRILADLDRQRLGLEPAGK